MGPPPMKGQDCWACASGPRGGPPGAELRPRTGHAAPRPAWSPEGLPGAAPSSSEETGAAPRAPRGLRVRTGLSRGSDLLRLSGSVPAETATQSQTFKISKSFARFPAVHTRSPL